MFAMHRPTEDAAISNVMRIVPLVIAALLSLLVLVYWVGLERTKFDEVALGKETTSVFPLSDGAAIHCSALAAGDPCQADYEKSGISPAVLWLGNSQLHAINQYHPGDENASLILHDKLLESGYWLATYSQPNASLEEHYLLFQYLRARYKLTAFVLPLVYDDLRESGVRSELLPVFDDPRVVEGIRSDAVGSALWEIYGAKDSAGNDLAGLKDTVQEMSERSLNGWLNSNWALWEARPDLRGSIFLGLYKLRNWLFGINPSSIRKMIPGRYKANMAAYEAMLKIAADNGIPVLAYVVPLRRDVSPPYDMTAYASFKQDAAALAATHGAVYADIDQMVPGDYWGTKDSTGVGGDGAELDFMHFQAAGHRLLAERLAQLLKPVLR